MQAMVFDPGSGFEPRVERCELDSRALELIGLLPSTATATARLAVRPLGNGEAAGPTTAGAPLRRDTEGTSDATLEV
jgi:hypothetical protein